MEINLEKVEHRLQREIHQLQGFSPAERYPAALKFIDAAYADFKRYIESHIFKEEKEEIAVFKEIHPRLLSFRIEEALRYTLIINEPIGTPKIVDEYYERALAGLQSFFHLHAFFYQYYKNRFQELDRLYFVRKASPSSLPVPETTQQDSPFSTPMSDLFAKFIAYERVQYFITDRVAALNSNEPRPQSVMQPEVNAIRWTGEVVNIVELAYGLWLTGQLNHGNASLNEIVKWLELHFQISIGIVQRRFTEIERRKRFSVTKFLDRMKEAVLQKMEDNHS